MFFHESKMEFEKFIANMSNNIKIDADIIEKDYYVCTVLKELAKNQDYLKAYFKGGTAVYKILDTMNRFSEDIDLTVEVVKDASNNSNRTRLKKSALGYKIPGLILEKEKTKDVKQSITSFYKYDSLFSTKLNPLHRAGEIQIEATSFTISEPYEIYTIEPILYKYANENEKNILKHDFNIEPFDIKVQKLERIFIDKLFAAEFYFEKNMYIDLTKHLYDITILLQTKRIKNFLKNIEEIKQIEGYKREEEIYRKGGVESKIKMQNFGYFNMQLSNELNEAFEFMQNKYIFDNKNKISLKDVQIALKRIDTILKSYNL